MTHHNQTKKLITWFLNLPLVESIDNKKHKVWSSNLRPHEAQLEDPKKLRKAQEGHLKEGKSQKPTKDIKSGKAKQNDREELRKAKKSKKSLKSGQKLKINTPLNTLNASSSP
jgi:CRISPR/Cas system-associated protein Cas10 (large subunit of type III CRISPR-Cas system)